MELLISKKKKLFLRNKQEESGSELNSRQVHEARVIADLRIMHSMVSQLYHHIRDIHQWYTEEDIIRYADQHLLTLDIQRNDETYRFFVSLAEERRRFG